MALLYADENFNYAVVEQLRLLGHDFLTVQEAGEQGRDDVRVLAFATAKKRAVLTCNRRHFIRLHEQTPTHEGILVCTDDHVAPLADRIDRALQTNASTGNQLIRIVRPP